MTPPIHSLWLLFMMYKHRDILIFCPQARQQAQIRHQMAKDSKADYSSILQKFNHEQHEYYHTHIPNIFQVSNQSLRFAWLRNTLFWSQDCWASMLSIYVILNFLCLKSVFKASVPIKHCLAIGGNTILIQGSSTAFANFLGLCHSLPVLEP